MTGIYDNSNGQCDSHMNLAGEDIRCQLAIKHDGWGHQNVQHEVIWG